MMRLLLAAFFLLWSATLTAQTVVQHVCGSACGSATSCTATLPNPVTAGDTIVTGNFFDIGDVVSQTDSLGNTYNLKLINMFYAANVTGGSDTITLHSGTTAYDLVVCAVELSGVTPAPYDQGDETTTLSIGPAGTPFYSGNVTTSYPNEYILGFAYPSTGPLTVGAGFTAIDNYANYLVLEGKNVTNRASYFSSASSGAANDSAAAWVMTFISSTQPSTGPVGYADVGPATDFGPAKTF